MRSPAEEAVLAAVDRLGLRYEVMDCDPAAADTAVFCERYGIPPERSANTILVASKKEPRRYVACVVTAVQRLDVNHRVRAEMGVPRVSFASAEEARALTGMEVGGVTPFALPANVEVWVDAQVMKPDWIVVGGGGRSIKLKLAPAELLKVPGLRTMEGLGLPRT